MKRFARVTTVNIFVQGKHDEHDLLSLFYGSSSHTITLDKNELEAGNWYFIVKNSAEAQEELNFTIATTFSTRLACPAVDGRICSNHGQCDYQTGNCLCEPGYTLEACHAVGVMPWPKDVETLSGKDVPTLDTDGWAFWSVPVGCEGMTLDVRLNTKNGTKSWPRLMVRRDQLPLMLQETAEYYDIFSIQGDAQRIVVKECHQPDGRSDCVQLVTFDEHGGTLWANGAPKPGIYYIGLYNEFGVGLQPLEGYSLTVKVEGKCVTSSCVSGFGGSDCTSVCPGVHPTYHYSNAPMPLGKACSGNGQCLAENGSEQLTCQCDTNHFGPTCQQTCPFTLKGDVKGTKIYMNNNMNNNMNNKCCVVAVILATILYQTDWSHPTQIYTNKFFDITHASKPET